MDNKIFLPLTLLLALFNQAHGMGAQAQPSTPMSLVTSATIGPRAPRTTPSSSPGSSNPNITTTTYPYALREATVPGPVDQTQENTAMDLVPSTIIGPRVLHTPPSSGSGSSDPNITATNSPHALREATAPEPVTTTTTTPCAQTTPENTQNNSHLDISGLTLNQINNLVNAVKRDSAEEKMVHSLICRNNNNVNDEVVQKLIERFIFLEELDLSGCSQLAWRSATIKFFENLKNLKSLDLSYTTVDGGDLLRIARTNPELRRLNLSCCEKAFRTWNPSAPHDTSLWETAVRAITYLKNLEELDVSNTLVTAAVLKKISNISGLMKLNLRGCRNFGFDPSDPFLKDMEEMGEKINLSRFAPIANLSQLEEIDVSGTYIDLESLMYIVSKLKKLNKLIIPAANPVALDKIRAAANPGLNIITMDPIIVLETFDDPRTSYTSNCSCSGSLDPNITATTCPCSLRGATVPGPVTTTTPCSQTTIDSAQNVDHVDISGWRLDQIDNLIDTAALDPAKKESVHDLSCRNNGNVNDEVLQKLIETFTFLEKLDLSGCSQLVRAWDGKTLWSFENLKNLKSLDLSNTKADIDALMYIADIIPGLRRLNLSGCERIFAPERTPEDPLVELCIGLCWNYGTLPVPPRYVPIEERAVRSTTYLKNLEELDVSNTLISPAILKAVADISGLRKLNLRGCRRLGFNLSDPFSDPFWEKRGGKEKYIRINFSVFTPIANLTQLEELDVSDTNIDFESLMYIVGKLKKLNKLIIPAALMADPVALDKIKAAAKPGLSIIGA